MTAAQFEMHRLILVPLTPIHIGGGEEARLLPEDYRLRNGFAERISVRAVLARLPEAERAGWLRDMGRVRADAAPDVIRDIVARLQQKATEADILECIPISPESAHAVDLGGEGKNRKNQIDAFFRAGGRPTLPGSSLKGALRTAWAGAMAQRFPQDMPELPPVGAWGGLSNKDRAQLATDMVKRLFALAGGKRAQDSDPLRDVLVADSPLPAGATRIDPVATWKRGDAAGGKPGAFGFFTVGQMHRERMRAVADGGAPPLVAVEIGLRSAAVRKKAQELAPDRRPRPDRTPPSLAALLAALEAQHAPLWQREVEDKFFAGTDGAQLRAALDLFADVRRSGDDPEAALVRLGWASHGEAKSLKPARRIERPQVKGDGRIAPEGSARHVVNLNNHPLPFGWALLVRADAWGRRAAGRTWLAAPAPRAAPVAGPARSTAAADPRAQTALGQQLRYRKGQRVRVDGDVGTLLEDVSEAARPQDGVNISFGGDIETVKIKDIEGPA